MPTTPGKKTPVSDTPTSTLSRLAKIEYAGPYVYTCKNGKDTIEFPDVDAMELVESDEMVEDLEAMNISAWCEKHLPKPAHDRWLKEKLTRAEGTQILLEVMKHYHLIVPVEGEGDASPA